MKRMLALMLLAAPAYAQSVLAPPNATLGETGSLHVQQNTGEFGYEYPIQVPASRGRYTPRLSVSYNSAGGVGAAGFGWSIPINLIERNLRASPNPDGSERFQYWL